MKKALLTQHGGRGRTNQNLIFKISVLVFTLIFLFTPHFSFGLPTDPQVQSGDVHIDQPDSSTMNVTASNQAIINWQSFNIAQNETVNFIQPFNSATVLNRVLGGGVSDITGALNANGTVILINPAGITFGSTAEVNVGGLIASSLNISDENFLAANYVFEKMQGMKAGEVVNMGNITGTRPGSVVALLGSVVQNQGVIVANVGNVALASGDKMTLAFDDKGYIQVDITDALDSDSIPNSSTATSAVRNAGQIKASGGKVIMTGDQVSDVFETLVNQEGYIEANSVEQHEGTISLRAGSGTVRSSGEIHADGTASNPDAGRIEVLGHEVKLEGGLISASGSGKGGRIFIGGDYLGGGDLPRSARTYVSSETTIHADSLGSGDGGRVIIWSDYETEYFGNATARGGAEDGNGGFMEISSKDHLVYRGVVDLRASLLGMTGTLLLDPRNVTISTGATAGGAFGGGDPNTFTPTANSSVLNVTVLETAWGSANIIVTTGSTGSQAGNITVSNAITAPANANSLTLQAANNIAMDANINMSASTGNLTLTADADSSGSGAFTQASGTSITMGGGNVSITGAGTATIRDITTTGAGTISISATAAGSSITHSSGTVTSASGTITLNAAKDITLRNIISTSGNINITADSDASGSGDFSQTAGTSIASTSGNISISANKVDLRDISTGSAGTIGITATGEKITFSAGTVSTASGTITYSAPSDITLGNITTTSGNLSVTADGKITDSGTLTVAGTATFAAGAGNDITLNTATNNFGTVAITTGDKVTLVDTNAIDLGASTVSGTLSVTAGGAITDSGALVVTGTATFTAGAANDITLDSGGNNFSTISVVSGSSVTIVDSNALTLGALSGGSFTITSGGTMTVGTVTASIGGISLTTTAGSIDDGNAGATNLTASSASSLTAASLIASSGDPLDVTITATLTVRTGAKNASNDSFFLAGTVTTLSTVTTTPGRGYLNGVLVYDPFFVPSPTPFVSNITPAFDSLDQYQQLIQDYREQEVQQERKKVITQKSQTGTGLIPPTFPQAGGGKPLTTASLNRSDSSYSDWTA